MKTHVWMTCLSLALSLFIAPKAMACRDCPFPIRVSQNQWLIPKRHVLITVHRQESSGSRADYIDVTLQDSDSGELLATGGGTMRKGERNVVLSLRDNGGRQIGGEIYWEDFNTPVIRARFECVDAQCAIDRQY